jgi:hypothetical protein
LATVIEAIVCANVPGSNVPFTVKRTLMVRAAVAVTTLPVFTVSRLNVWVDPDTVILCVVPAKITPAVELVVE